MYIWLLVFDKKCSNMMIKKKKPTERKALIRHQRMPFPGIKLLMWYEIRLQSFVINKFRSYCHTHVQKVVNPENQ